MMKSSLALAAVGWIALGVTRPDERPSIPFDEQHMFIEYFANTNEAVVRINAQSEARLEQIEVRDPDGRRVLQIWAPEQSGRGIAGLTVDTLETTLQEVLVDYPQGMYDVKGRTQDGQLARGRVELVHDLLQPPIVLFPEGGSVNVPTTFVARWLPDPEAVRYVVELEQDDNDGLVVELGPGSSSFRIPPGVLAPGKESHFEVGAVNDKGNVTVVEAFFRTL